MVKKDKNGSIGPMEFYEARKKLRTMDKVVLLGLASKQRGISRCAIGGEACGLYFCYEGWGFCVSEILGQGCHQKSEDLTSIYSRRIHDFHQ